MNVLRKTLKITGISLLSLVLLALVIPVLFKKQVQALVRKEINKQLNATVDFSDVTLSLFRHFPKATVSITGLTIVGKDYFAKDTLIAAGKMDVTAGLFSVLKGKNIKVYGVYVRQPRIHLLVNQFGKANWDITRSSADTGRADTTGRAFRLSLRRYEISDGYLEYSDKKANTYTELAGLNHAGSGDITAEVFTLSTSTSAASAKFVQDGIPYLVNAKTDLDADIRIDNTTNTYTFATDDIRLNELKLSAEGFVQMLNAETFKMDFKFSSPTNEFRNILSMVPALYTKDFAKMKTGGEASFSGFVKGIYAPQQLPAYDLKLLVKNGSFQYPDLPKPVKNIHLSLHALNPDGNPDHSVIDIRKGHLEFDNEPFDFSFTYRNPVTTTYIDAAARGRLDLSRLSKFIRLAEGTRLGGQVWADAYVRGPLNAITQQSGPFSAGGFFDIRNLYYTGKNFPQPVQNGNIRATVTHKGGVADNTVIDIAQGRVELGKDPVDFTLRLSNPVSALNFSGRAKGRFTLDNLKQFTTWPAGTSLSGIMNADMGFAGSRAAIQKSDYDKITLSGSADFSDVHYRSNDYPAGIHIPSSSLLFNTKNIALHHLTGKYLGTNFSASGTLNNLVGYMMENQLLTGNLTATADNMNLNDWIGTPASMDENTAPANARASSGPFLVPPGVNFTVNASVNQLKYDKVDYSHITGAVLINDENLQFQQVKADALDGSILINGSYSTKINKDKPDISLSYDIKDMNVQKAFYALNTMQFLMPIGKFLSGKLHSQLSLVGNLKSDMMPLLNSLTGKGNLLLLEGVLAKFAPLEKIAAVLDVERLKSISVKDIKNYIEFANGKVLVKPFTVRIREIEMEIAGFHGFDQSMDYGINMKLPRALMGRKGNELVNDLVAKAQARSVPVKLGDMINLHLKLTGTVSNPAVAVSLKEMAGDMIRDLEEQAKEFAKAKADSLKIKTRDSLISVKKHAEQKAKEKLAEKGIDTTRVTLENIKDTVIERVKDTVKKKVTDTLKKKIRKWLGD